jgi:hypothetical protein
MQNKWKWEIKARLDDDIEYCFSGDYDNEPLYGEYIKNSICKKISFTVSLRFPNTDLDEIYKRLVKFNQSA